MLRQLVNHFIRHDTREPYLLGPDGRALAFVVRGEEGNTPNHEDFTHGMDGTDEALGHQDPVVIERTVWRSSWQTLFVPQPIRIQERYYPYTVKHDGTEPDLAQVEARVSAQADQLRRRKQQAYHAPMPRWMERKAWNQETNKQRGRGVPGFRLRGRQDSRVQAAQTPRNDVAAQAAPLPPEPTNSAVRATKRPQRANAGRAKRAARATRRR